MVSDRVWKTVIYHGQRKAFGPGQYKKPSAITAEGFLFTFDFVLTGQRSTDV